MVENDEIKEKRLKKIFFIILLIMNIERKMPLI